MKRIIVIFLILILSVGCYPQTKFYNVVPSSNSTYSVGSPTRYFSDGYFSNLIVDNLTIGGVTVAGDNVTGVGTAGKMTKWIAPAKIADATNTDVQVAGAVAASHAQNTDTHLTSDGTTIVIDAGVIMRDLYTDRWAYNNSNTFFGIDVAGAGNLTDAGGGSDATCDTAYGNNTVRNITTGYYNTAIGHYALTALTTGNFNTAVGELSQGYLTSGQFNTSVGVQSLLYNNGNYNTAIGQWAGENNTGSSNVFVGFSAGKESGAANNKLYIDNSDTATPLIYGDFSTDNITVHGTLNVRNKITAPTLVLTSIPAHANNAAAVAGGVPVGGLYRTGGDPDLLCIVH